MARNPGISVSVPKDVQTDVAILRKTMIKRSHLDVMPAGYSETVRILLEQTFSSRDMDEIADELINFQRKRQ